MARWHTPRSKSEVQRRSSHSSRGTALALVVLIASLARPTAAQTGQPSVTPAPGDMVVHFDLVGVTSPGGPLSGFFTYDFTQHGWVTVEIHFPGSGISYGNVFTDPVHISTMRLSGSHDSQTTSYDFARPLQHALTPTTGSAIAIDPPSTPPSQLNAWLVIDDGNTAVTCRISGGSIVPVVPAWLDLGFAKAGGSGTPHLAGTGPMTANSANHLDLTGAAPSATAYLGLGLSQSNSPLLGGTLITSPVEIVALTTSSTGSIALPFTWPAGVPAGTAYFLQVWVVDPAATNGVSASNGLRMVAH